MNSPQDSFVLRNGFEIPCIGFGTWKTPDGEVGLDAVRTAIEVGYRHIDTAAAYDNEKTVGKAIEQSGVRRADLFVTSKLWNTDRGFDKTLKAFQKSLDDLKLDYLDLYLIHWPAAKGPEEEWQKTNSETWRAFEKLYDEGYVRSIGVSNFKDHHLEPLMKQSEIDPMVNQIELHPGFPQFDTREFCAKHGILVEAWSPLGSGKVLKDKRIKEMAEKYGCSPAQLCIRWALQHDVLPLPKSVTPERIKENADVFGFEIDAEDMDAIDSFETFGNSKLDPDTVKF